MDVPPLLPPHLVSLLLSYLSRLDDPLPPHLVSTPLRQRHHFLGLGNVIDTADDVAAYLSWPSTSGSERDTLVDMLNSLPSPENFDPLSAYPTKYSYDGETVYAHAEVPTDGLGGNGGDGTAGLRLVFRWEAKGGEGVVLVQDREAAATTNEDNWKYHDAKPMPCPPNSYDTPQKALQPYAEESTPTQSHPPPSAQLPARFDSYLLPEPEQGSDDDDDAYWNSYGRTSSDDEDEGVYSYSRGAASTKADDDEKAEEAYWAQYASVHGTADSTRHSPLPPKRRLHDPCQPVRPSLDYSYLDRCGSQDFLAPDIRQPDGSDHLYDSAGPHIDYVKHLTTFRGRETSPDGVPCPEALSRRLHNLSPRISTAPSPAPTADALELETAESPDAASSDTSDTQILTPPSDTQTSIIPPLVLPSLLAEKGRNADEDVGVHEAVRGIYKLWLTTQKGKSENFDASSEKDRFLEVVRVALKLV